MYILEILFLKLWLILSKLNLLLDKGVFVDLERNNLVWIKIEELWRWYE